MTLPETLPSAAPCFPASAGSDQARRHHHPGAEFLYVVSGKLAVMVGDDEHELAAGDSMYFDASVPHAYRRIGNRACSAVVVTAGG